MATTPDFTTVAVAPLLDHLCTAVDAAREKAAGDQRWLNAIDAAWDHLLFQVAVDYSPEAHALRVESASERGKTYIANGSCQCRAFAQHNACWHRAAARLVRRALELQAPAPEPAALESEAFALAGEIAASSGYLMDWDDCRAQAAAELPAVLDFARAWDAQAAALGARIARASMVHPMARAA